MKVLPRIVLPAVAVLSAGALVVAPAWSQERALVPSDVHDLVDVSAPAFSPDGEWIAYSVTRTDVAKDRRSSDLYRVSWDGDRSEQLTHTEKESESSPSYSPDGRYLAFLAARERGGDDEAASKTQVWLLPTQGGEARRLTSLPGGVSSFEWSPDSQFVALLSKDPEKEEEKGEDGAGESKKTHDTPDPIVVDRYQFKRDRVGYLSERRTRLYTLNVESRDLTQLTQGPYDDQSPAWSPDSTKLVFVSKRGGDPDRHNDTNLWLIENQEGAEPRRLTDWEGPDDSPQFSPDGRHVVYLRDGPAKYAGYDPDVVAVVSVEGGEPRILTGELDRASYSPRFAADGQHVVFLVQDDRTRALARVSSSGGAVEFVDGDWSNRQFVLRSFDLSAGGRVAALITHPDRPAEIEAHDSGSWRALTSHNAEWLERFELATVEAIDATSADGVRVGAILLKPPGYEPGRAYPTIAYIHGGPVSQDGFEFDSMSQVLAAGGYVVVNPNYRGSNGRGRDFARAIYADWGNLEIQDIHAVVDHLVDTGVADPLRLGIGGWSYGGMNTNYAIATDTRFRAAVSGSSIANMITGYGTDQYTVQYENEVGLPWEDLDVYFRISYPFFKADRIKTPTLFLCGEKDFNVPLINSEQMYQALRSLEVPTQLVIYPGQYHGLSKPSYIEDRMVRMLDWYGQYLGQDGVGAEELGGTESGAAD